MSTVRYLDCPTRMPGESGREFVDRMLRELSSKPKEKPTAPLPCGTPYTTIAKATPSKVPIAWTEDLVKPKPWKAPRVPLAPPGPHLPLDAEQQKWLAAYADKYPGQYDPTQCLTLAETKAREAKLLTITTA
jgi:hypothetical protein